MKGLLFGGCSFTWGQGLYYYSNLPKLIYPEPDMFDPKKLTDAHINFMQTKRYPRLVANHFNTFEIVKNLNGGCEDDTFEFFKLIFEDKEKKVDKEWLHTQRFDYEDFDYMIIQLSQLQRNLFEFEINNQKYYSNFRPDDGYTQTEMLMRWMRMNNYTVDDWCRILSERQFQRLKKEVEFYQNKGLKVKILTWENELIDYILNDSNLSKIFIKLNYDNQVFNSIQDLMKYEKNMTIQYDNFFGENPPMDHHPSILCHRVIADNIIKTIEIEQN